MNEESWVGPLVSSFMGLSSLCRVLVSSGPQVSPIELEESMLGRGASHVDAERPQLCTGT